MASSQVSCGADADAGIGRSEDVAALSPRSESADVMRLGAGWGIQPAGKISEAASHLRVALLQIEDEIVKQHVSEALKLLEEK